MVWTHFEAWAGVPNRFGAVFRGRPVLLQVAAPRDHGQAQAGRLERQLPAQGPVKFECDCLGCRSCNSQTSDRCVLQ